MKRRRKKKLRAQTDVHDNDFEIFDVPRAFHSSVIFVIYKRILCFHL